MAPASSVALPCPAPAGCGPRLATRQNLARPARVHGRNGATLMGLLAVAVPERHWYDVYAAADAARDAALAAGRGGAVMQPPLGAVTLGGDVGAGSLDARAAVVDGEERGGRPKVGGKGCGSYLIVSMQRSGTTTICTDINNIKGKFKKRPGQATNSSVGDFVCQYELLNSGELQSGHRFLEETNHTPAWAAKHPQEMVRQAAQKARNKWGACVWGFKIFDKQLAAVDQIVDRFDKCIIYRCARPILASPLFSRSAHLSHTPALPSPRCAGGKTSLRSTSRGRRPRRRTAGRPHQRSRRQTLHVPRRSRHSARTGQISRKG